MARVFCGRVAYVPATAAVLAADVGRSDSDEPWQHELMQEQRSKAEEYLVHRAKQKDRQQRKVLSMGSGVFVLGLLVSPPVFAFAGRWWAWFTACLVTQLGLAICLVCDHDINSFSGELYPWVTRAAGTGVVISSATLAALAFVYPDVLGMHSFHLGGFPVAVYTVWYAPQIDAQLDSYPLASETIILWMLGAGVEIAVESALALLGVVENGTAVSGTSRAINLGVAALLLSFWLWLLTPRTRFGDRWWAVRTEYMDPTARSMMGASMGFLMVFAMLYSKALFPKSPPAGWERTRRMELEAVGGLLVSIAPVVLAWPCRAKLYGALAKIFESAHRLQDGVFIASLLAGEPLRVGDEYWLRERAHTAGVTLVWEDKPQWFRGVVSSIEPTFFTVDLMPHEVCESLERRTAVHAVANMPAEDLFRCACASLYHVHARELSAELDEHSSAHSCLTLGDIGSLSNSLRRAPCRPGATDFYVLHSWHDDRALRLATLARVTRQFEVLHGREATLWLDSVCVHPAYQEEALLCLPIYMQACRGVLVLWGDSFCERLWCVWELYTAFAFSDGNISLTVAILRPDAAGGDAREEVWRRLQAFDLSLAHCSNPNEEKKLRRAISGAPGGARAFELTVRGLASQLQLQANLRQPAAKAGKELGDFTLLVCDRRSVVGML